MAEQASLGIDLGTTYSCMAYMNEEGKPTVEKNYEQEDTTPSVVLFDENGQILVGTTAKELSAMYPPERSVTAIKRRMGTDYSVTVDDTEYTPVTISAMIVKKMLKDFADSHGDEVTRAVITVPAYFGQPERDATKEAGRVAGLTDVTIINEPTAAAISFGYGREGEGKKRVLVYDLGGGTFDVTILEIDGHDFTAVATDGERLLGGKDWDHELIRIIIRKVSETLGIDAEEIESDKGLMMQLELDAENLKKRLSTAESTRGTITVGAKKTVYTVTRSEFDSATKPLLQATIEKVNAVLGSKGFTDKDIDAFLLVGGSSRMPQVREAITSTFPDTDVQLYDPDQSVAKGAAIFCMSNDLIEAAKADAEAKAEEEPAQAEEPAGEAAVEKTQTEGSEPSAPSVTDNDEPAVTFVPPEPVPEGAIEVHNVLMKSFGIRASDNGGKNEHISNIIFRNEALPISASREYNPVEDGQTSIRIEIFENPGMNNDEGRKMALVDGNPVGEFQMDLPEGVTKKTPVKVTFTATNEGILMATVDCLDAHGNYQLTSRVSMSDDEIKHAQGLMEKVAL